jgi:hypothetical protein
MNYRGDHEFSLDGELPSLFAPHGAPTFALQPGAAGVALARRVAAAPTDAYAFS